MPRPNNTRRDVLKGLAVGAGLAATGALPETSQAGPLSPEFNAGDKNNPWSLLAPVAPGDHLGFGWHAARLDTGDGAWTLSLAHAELGLARVAICYRQSEAQGLVSTDLLDIVLMDGGAGDNPTEESVGRVVMALSRIIRKNELAIAQNFPHLMTHAERIERFGPESL